MNKEPRLRFTDEERADPALEKPIRKAEKAAARADQAQANIPKKKVRQTVIDPDTGKKTSKLTFEDKKKPLSKVSQGVKEAPVHLVAGKLHKEIRETEQDNVGVESAHKSEEAVETGAYLVREGYRSHKLKPYRKAAQAERQLEKANINVLYQKSLQENPQFSSNPLSRWQQKQAIKRQYAAAKHAGQTAGNTAQAASKTGKVARTVKEKAQQAGAFVMRHKKGFLIAGVLFLIACMLMNTMSSCSMMAQSIGSVLSGTTYPSDDPEMLAVEADYVAREVQLQEEIDNIESSHPGYDEYRYDLGMIGHDPHELAAFLSAVLQGYTRQSAQAELARVFAAQYQLTLTEEVEIRYRTETSTDPETGETTSEEVPYEYYILNVKLASKPISAVVSELLTTEQMKMYQVYRQTMGNKPLLFGGGSPDTSGSEDLSGVQFINGTRPGNPQLVELAKRQVGNVGGYPYWSWYGFDSRVEWCACFVSWCYNQAGKSEQKYDRHCTCHHISTKALKSIILKTIQETCHYVSLNEQEFVYSLQEESAMKDIAVSETVKKRIERNQKRVHELDMLIRKIYEDNVIGRLPDRLFQSMLTDYENEQNELNKIIETDTADMQRIIGGQNNVERFLKLVKKYENITELTPAMINEFIDKILVHEPQGKGADRTTEVEIYLNYVGQFQVPVEQHEPTEEERIAAEKEADRLRRKRESNRKYMKKIREKSKKFAEHERIAEEKSSDSKLCAEQNATSKSNRQKVKGEKIA